MTDPLPPEAAEALAAEQAACELDGPDAGHEVPADLLELHQALEALEAGVEPGPPSPAWPTEAGR